MSNPRQRFWIRGGVLSCWTFPGTGQFSVMLNVFGFHVYLWLSLPRYWRRT